MITPPVLKLDVLLSPLTIRGLTLPNRVVMSAMTREKSHRGRPGDDVANYYRRRAEGQVGLIVTEGAGIMHPAAVDRAGVPLMHGADAIAGWAEVFAQVHDAGGHIIPQLWHQGVMRDAELSPAPDVPSVRPSGIWGPSGGLVSLDADHVARMSGETEAMSAAEIDGVVEAYASSARDAVAAGADGVAIHAAHGYLIDTFLWAQTNRRTDKWGGDLVQRTRFAVEVIAAVREVVGSNRPIFFRFSQFKMQDYNARLADTPRELEKILVPIAEAGVDVFDGSQRYFDTAIFDGSQLNLAGWAKKLTGRLSMAVGGVGLDQGKKATRLNVDNSSGSVNNLERVIARMEAGEFDLIGVGRSLLNDPRWWAKVQNGEPQLSFDPANLTRLT